MKKYRNIIIALAGGLLPLLSACNDTLSDAPEVNEDGIGVGEAIQFYAHVPSVRTREKSEAEEAYDRLISTFDRVQDDYAFTVEMWEKGDGDAVKIATADYNPIKQTVDDVTTYDAYGTLEEASKTMYWPSNMRKYGFYAVSKNSSKTLELDQTSADLLFRQDLIEGYGYVPGWDEDANEGVGAPLRDFNTYSYLTSKEWYAANKALGTPVGMTDNDELIAHWKKIPLYMQHKRSRITILLKAGEGVEREQIAYNDLTLDQIAAEIYSYDDDNNQSIIQPLIGSYECDYTPGVAGDTENTVSTICYDAIVNPHNYAADNNMTDQKLLSVNLSGLKFSFCASNDGDYSSEPDAQNTVVKDRYNLQAGKHLILTVTLSTDTRKILITAYVVDWTDYPFASMCDDFGNASKPEAIHNKAELIAMLTNSDKNKAGNVFVILPEDFDLTKEGGWGANDYELKATLKLANATITTNQRLFGKIASSGSISNGKIVIKDMDGDVALDCAVAQENYGTIKQVTVTRGESSRKATSAGFVTTNYGSIYNCISELPVYNPGGSDEVLVGGIAAQMLFPLGDDNTPDTSTLPYIDLCKVNARVDGGPSVKGGGIVGKAEGKLANNTFEYGITLLQDVDRFKNILFVKGSQSLEINGNDWSTDVPNTGAGITVENLRPLADRYNQIIDSQAELNELLSSGTYNQTGKRVRIADSFSVDDTWDLGAQSNDLTTSNKGNLFCNLDCNSKTITLTGASNAKMLFSNVQGQITDLVLVLDKPIVAMPSNAPDSKDEEKITARAPLAYSVVGTTAELNNIKVKMGPDAFIQASSPAGLVVWAYDGATIDGCQSDADVRIALPEGTGEQQTYFVGGLVSTAAKATILRSTYQRQSLNSTEDAHAMTGSAIYYGGIVGGTNSKSHTSAFPNLHIADCVSWLNWTITPERPHAAWGGIVGYSKYENSTIMVNAMDKCEGNYWNGPVGAPSQGWADGMTEEKVIGKKNSVIPQRDLHY